MSLSGLSEFADSLRRFMERTEDDPYARLMVLLALGRIGDTDAERERLVADLKARRWEKAEAP